MFVAGPLTRATAGTQALINFNTVLDEIEANFPLGGEDIKDNAITDSKIASGAVSTTNIPDLAITNPKLADGAVDQLKLAAGAVQTFHIAPLAVTGEEIASNAVNTSKIIDLSITTPKIAAQAITSGKIASGAVGTIQIADLAVTAPKLATDAVETAKIKDLNVTSGKIASGAVGTIQIADLAVTAPKLAADAVETAKIKDLNVTSGKIASGAAGTIQIADLAVTTPKINNLAITDTKIALDARDFQLTNKRRVGRFYGSSQDTNAATQATTIDLLTAIPFIVTRSESFDRISMNVTISGAGSGRLGIYADDGSGFPGALIDDSGIIAVGSTGEKNVVIDETLAPGLYWLVSIFDVIATMSAINEASVRGVLGHTSVSTDAANTIEHTQAFGALPNPFPSSSPVFAANKQLRILLKRS